MNKLVVHNKDGSTLKGHSSDFNPALPFFHIATLEKPDDSVKVWFDNLKAVFIVMDFIGDAQHLDSLDFSRIPLAAKHIIITFKDGEIFYGTSDLAHNSSKGFYIFPADNNSNTIRAYVLKSAIENVKII